MAKIYRNPAHMTDNELQTFDAEYTDINDEKELTAPQKTHWAAVKTEIQSRAPSNSSGDSGEVTHEPAPEPAPTAPEPKGAAPPVKAQQRAQTATAPADAIAVVKEEKELSPFQKVHSYISQNSVELLAQLPQRTMEERVFVGNITHAIISDPRVRELMTTGRGRMEIKRAIIDAAAVGLPIGERAYLITYGKDLATRTLKFTIGYQGIMEIARRDPHMEIHAPRAVFNGDHFIYGERNGDPFLEWQPKEEGEETFTRLSHTFVCWKFRGKFDFRVVGKKEILAAKEKAKTGKVWVSGNDSEKIAMAMKTAVLRAAKSWPKGNSAALDVAISATEHEFGNDGGVDDRKIGGESLAHALSQ